MPLWSRTLVALGLALALAPLRPALAAERVDVLLVLAVDVSLSISNPKFELERRGYAEAFGNPAVLRAIAEGPEGRIGVALVEWAGADQQHVVVDWTTIAGAADAKAFGDKLVESTRSYYGRTAVGSAIDYAAGMIARAPWETDRRVIDVSGDGTSNGGEAIHVSRDAAVAKGITINGIVILTDPTNLPEYLVAHTNPPGGLAAYYRDNVVGGPGSFVITAQDFESFGRSLVIKLLREIS